MRILLCKRAVPSALALAATILWTVGSVADLASVLQVCIVRQ